MCAELSRILNDPLVCRAWKYSHVRNRERKDFVLPIRRGRLEFPSAAASLSLFLSFSFSFFLRRLARLINPCAKRKEKTYTRLKYIRNFEATCIRAVDRNKTSRSLSRRRDKFKGSLSARRADTVLLSSPKTAFSPDKVERTATIVESFAISMISRNPLPARSTVMPAPSLQSLP